MFQHQLVFGCVIGSKSRGTADTCPFSSQQLLDDAETGFSFVLVLGMQDSRDPAEAQDRRLTAEPSAGFSVSHVVYVAVHFLVIGFWLTRRNIKSRRVLEVSAGGENCDDADLVARLNSQRTSQI